MPDHYYDTINAALATAAFRPRALFTRFNIEKIATTEGALDTLADHDTIAREWPGHVVTTYRPDDVIDADKDEFIANVEKFGATTWAGYLKAHQDRRAFFRAHGATATDHGHPTAATANLASADASALFDRLLRGKVDPTDAELFRAQMLTEMAKMSCDDGMTMQIHPGSFRNHNPSLFAKYGPNIGADIPMTTDYVHAMKPMLDVVGNRADLTVILFTLDETNYLPASRGAAGRRRLSGLKLGPGLVGFHDSPEGMLRFRRQVTETAGFYNTVGFNDDTRAFLSIPARHDLARRIDAAYLAELVTSHRLDADEAAELIVDLAYNFPKAAYKL